MVNLDNIKTKTQFIITARRMRSHADNAEKEFLEFLYLVETTRTDLWSAPGLQFVDFIERANLCQGARYSHYAVIRAAHGKSILAIGVHGILRAGTFKEKKDQEQMLELTRKWEKTNDGPAPERSAEVLARTVRDVRVGRKHGDKSLAVIAEEAERYKAQNEALRLEIRGLKKALRAMQAERNRALRELKILKLTMQKAAKRAQPAAGKRAN